MTDVADLILRCEMLREIGETGPGLISMSPARRRIKQSRKNLGLLEYRRMEVDNRLRRKWIGMWSRHLETEENGNGWYRSWYPEARLLVVSMREKLVGRGK